MFSFIETKLFTRLVQDYLTDDEYRELQARLIEQPEVGNVIAGSGGVRKLRWGGARPREARRLPGDLLLEARPACVLDADHVPQKRGR
jgi:hypothetical protein